MNNVRILNANILVVLEVQIGFSKKIVLSFRTL